MKRLSMIVCGVAVMGVAGANFDNFNLGSIDQQQGWTGPDSFLSSFKVGNWDQEIKDVRSHRLFRMSNALTSEAYASQIFSVPSLQIAGESGAALWNNNGNHGASPISPPLFGAYASTDIFYSKIAFRSATRGAQTGLIITLSPSAKQSDVRMSYLQIADTGEGFELRFYETLGNGTFPKSPTTIASGLSYTGLHTIELTIRFLDGLTTAGNGELFGNDVVLVFLNGSYIHYGTSWESYYAVTPNQQIIPGQRRVQAVNSLVFSVANPAVTSTLGNGLYFEEVTVDMPTKSVTTSPSL